MRWGLCSSAWPGRAQRLTRTAAANSSRRLSQCRALSFEPLILLPPHLSSSCSYLLPKSGAKLVAQGTQKHMTQTHLTKGEVHCGFCVWGHCKRKPARVTYQDWPPTEEKKKQLEAPKAVADFCRRKKILFWWDNSFGTEESSGNWTHSSFLPKEGEETASPLLEAFHVDWLNLPSFLMYPRLTLNLRSICPWGK